jgi:hypothetical protein
MYDGRTATFLGKGRAEFKRRKFKTQDVFYVAPRGSLNLLSYGTMQRLGLRIIDTDEANAAPPQQPLTLNVQTDTEASLKSSFPGVFQDGLGKCTVAKATLKLKENETPVYRRARPVPYASLPVVEQELDRLLDSGVIKPVKHTDWAIPIRVVKKPDGSTRRGMDYSTGRKDALQLHQHYLPVSEDFTPHLIAGHARRRSRRCPSSRFQPGIDDKSSSRDVREASHSVTIKTRPHAKRQTPVEQHY